MAAQSETTCNPPQLAGRCSFMCPVAERKRREQTGQLSVFEVDYSHAGHKPRGRPVKPVSSSSLAVKEYVRAGAGHHVPTPDELRPPNILVKTMEYLVGRVIERRDQPWHVVYSFINNRCQSVRQDITYQQLEGPEVVHIYMLAVRFYIYAQYRLAGESVERFDPKLNTDQLQQCLTKLLRLHSKRQCSASDTSVVATEWAEAESYYLLTNLGSNEAALHSLCLPVTIRKEPSVMIAFKLSLLASQNNFVRFFRLFSHLPPLGKCAVYPHLHTLCRHGLQTLCNAYCVGNKPSAFPLRVLAQWLMFDGVGEAAEYCTALGLRVDEKNALLQKTVALYSVEKLKPHPITIHEASSTTCGQLIFSHTPP